MKWQTETCPERVEDRLFAQAIKQYVDSTDAYLWRAYACWLVPVRQTRDVSVYEHTQVILHNGNIEVRDRLRVGNRLKGLLIENPFAGGA